MLQMSKAIVFIGISMMLLGAGSYVYLNNGFGHAPNVVAWTLFSIGYAGAFVTFCGVVIFGFAPENSIGYKKS